VSAEQRLEAVARGRVQGVGFRFHVVRAAERLGVVGWVANEADGAVRCVAEGSPEDLQRLLAELREGPAGASVDRVDESWSPATGEFVRFAVRSGWHGGD
jgi:acylphosphatase